MFFVATLAVPIVSAPHLGKKSHKIKNKCISTFSKILLYIKALLELWGTTTNFFKLHQNWCSSSSHITKWRNVGEEPLVDRQQMLYCLILLLQRKEQKTTGLVSIVFFPFVLCLQVYKRLCLQLSLDVYIDWKPQHTSTTIKVYT